MQQAREVKSLPAATGNRTFADAIQTIALDGMESGRIKKRGKRARQSGRSRFRRDDSPASDQTIKKVLSHFKWLTFPFLDGSAHKHPHLYPPLEGLPSPVRGGGNDGRPDFSSPPSTGGD